MADGASSGEDKAIYGINVTPLVDITLVLLIIIMVVGKLIVSQGMPMELPGGGDSSKPDPRKQELLEIDLRADGSMQLNGTPITSERQLFDATQGVLHGAPEIRAVIRAHNTVKHGRIVRTLDVLKAAGVQRIGFKSPQDPAQVPHASEPPQNSASP